MAKQTLDLGRRWYVLHTYSGYEENVKRNLEQRIDTFNMSGKIFSVLVPKEKKIKIKKIKATKENSFVQFTITAQQPVKIIHSYKKAKN